MSIASILEIKTNPTQDPRSCKHGQFVHFIVSLLKGTGLPDVREAYFASADCVLDCRRTIWPSAAA